jgi:secondary thiamine-phosphate synthase enzyme
MLSEVTCKTSTATEMIDITDDVAKIVKKSNVKDGLVVIYSSHTTCAVTVNENTDPGLKADILETLATVFPAQDPKYQHRGENTDAHIKATMVGESVMVLIEDRALKLGKWQSIYLCEFDGPRDRELQLKIIAG